MRGAIGVRWGRGGSSRRSHAAANVVPRAGLGLGAAGGDFQVIVVVAGRFQADGEASVADRQADGIAVVVEDHGVCQQDLLLAVAVDDDLAGGLEAEAPGVGNRFRHGFDQGVDVFGQNVGVEAERRTVGVDLGEDQVGARLEIHAAAERVGDDDHLAVGHEADERARVQQFGDHGMREEEILEGVVASHDSLAPCR